ncbi:hypothetical protein HMI54_015644, partial [Coelomomyces lativittatus]
MHIRINNTTFYWERFETRWDPILPLGNTYTTWSNTVELLTNHRIKKNFSLKKACNFPLRNL